MSCAANKTEFAPVLLAAQQTQAVDVYKAEERGCLYTSVHTASRIYGISLRPHRIQSKTNLCTYFMSGRSLIRVDSVTIHQERPSITEHQQIRRGPFTSKRADCEEYEVVPLRTSPNQRGSNQSSNIPQLFTNAPQITTRVVTNLDP